MINLRIGEKVTFTPHTLLTQENKFHKTWRENNWLISEKLTGEICYINREHGWFRVRYEAFGNVNYECFQIVGPRNQYYPRIVG